MNQDKLTKEMIAQPELWRCVMEVGQRRIEAVLVPPVESERIIHRSILLNPDAPTHEKAVQDAIYDNPLLLSDFKSIDALIDSDAFVTVPRAFAEAADAEAVLEAAGVDCKGDETAVSTPGESVALVYAVNPELAGFLRRTFFNVKINHRLAPIVDAELKRSAGQGASVLAAIAPGRLDIVGSDGGKLLVANTFAFNAPADAAYYILATVQSLGLEEPQIRIAGGGADADAVATLIATHCCEPEREAAPAALLAMGREAAGMPESIIKLLS